MVSRYFIEFNNISSAFVGNTFLPIHYHNITLTTYDMIFNYHVLYYIERKIKIYTLYSDDKLESLGKLMLKLGE